MSTIIKMRCIDQVLTFESTPVIASGGLEEDTLQVSFCSKWDGLAKTAVFWLNDDEAYHAPLDINDSCVIPREVLADEGVFYFGIFGVSEDGRQRTTEAVRYTVAKGAITSGTKPSDPTPDVYTQLMARYAEVLVEADVIVAESERVFQAAVAQSEQVIQSAQAVQAAAEASAGAAMASQAAAEASAAASSASKEAAERAAAHTHTAEDVGARPASWTPTAAETGARPDTWLPTLAELGAAPAGFGLGVVSWNLIADCNQPEQGNGFYALTSTTLNAPTLLPLAVYGVLLSQIRGDKVFQTLRQDGYIATRSGNQATQEFSEWEYVNPPMQLGVEYLTTERINQKAVYKRNNAGVIEYRLDGETTWKPYAEAVGGLARNGSNAMTEMLSVQCASPALILKSTKQGDYFAFGGNTQRAFVIAQDAQDDSSNRRMLELRTATYGNLVNAVCLHDIVNGTDSSFDLLHTGNITELGVAKIERGSYAGTGEISKSLTFSFVPKLVIITSRRGTWNNDFGDYGAYRMIWTQGLEYDVGPQGTYGNHNRRYTLEGSTLSWRYENPSSGDGYYHIALNESGETYYYTAIG